MGKVQEWLTKEKMILVEGWARDGLTNEQIASNMGITESTLYAWKAKYPDFADTLKRGKEVVDRQVENALLKRALGFKCIEKVTQITEKHGVVVKEIEKDVYPDTTAIIYWLKNRKPADWRERDKTIIEVGKEGNEEDIGERLPPLDLSGMSNEEVMELVKMAFRKEEDDEE